MRCRAGTYLHQEEIYGTFLSLAPLSFLFIPSIFDLRSFSILRLYDRFSLVSILCILNLCIVIYFAYREREREREREGGRGERLSFGSGGYILFSLSFFFFFFFSFFFISLSFLDISYHVAVI